MSIITAFLLQKGIPIPDNSTPDTPVVAKVKQLLSAELELSTDIVVNKLYKGGLLIISS